MPTGIKANERDTLQRLAREAREDLGAKGDQSAFELAKRMPDASFLEFVTFAVKRGDMTKPLWERLERAHDRAQMELEADRLGSHDPNLLEAT